MNISTPQLFMASYNTNKNQQKCNSGGNGIFGTIGCIFSGLTGNLNSNTVLIPYAYNALTFNSMQSQPTEYPAAGEPQLYSYGASSSQLATAGQNTINSLIAIRQPLSISAIPNDYIFVLANTIMPELQPATRTAQACTISTNTIAVTGKLITLANGTIPQDSSGHQLLPTEVAASPDGKLVFVTSQHSSDIFVLSGENLSYIDTYNLVYSSDVAPLGITYQGGSGSSPGSSAAVPNVNITDWIAWRGRRAQVRMFFAEIAAACKHSLYY